MSAAFTFRANAKSRREESDRMRFKKFNKIKEVSTFSFKNINLEKKDDEIFEDAIGGDPISKYTTDTRVTIDMMGTIFKISQDTLYRMRFFRDIFSSEEDVSEIFMDRSPDTFRDIIRYVTYGVLPAKAGKPGDSDDPDVTMFLEDCFFYGLSGMADKLIDRVFPSLASQEHHRNLVTGKMAMAIWKIASCDIKSNPLFGERLGKLAGSIHANAWIGKTETDRLNVSEFVTHAIQHGSVCVNDILKTRGAVISHCACVNGQEFLIVNGKTTCPTCVRKMR